MTLFFSSLILLLLGIHFLPTFVAAVRNSRHTFLIFVLNLLFGWTIIGWLVLLIWACVGEPKSRYYAVAP
jgi:hypothetical protein